MRPTLPCREAIEFPTTGGKTAHAFFYPPTNPEFTGPPGDAPPLLVLIHGGPTAATAAQFRLTTQYWTSRGFGVCDVNYGGSTGYGREYRNRLRDSWGVVDVDDAANAAKYLAQQGKADPKKLIIRGGSAGGYTTLACLTFSDVFSCGASSYGISDLALMAHDTHKFESRYLDQLVGPYPQEEARYRERSPIFHLEKFNRPVILLARLGRQNRAAQSGGTDFGIAQEARRAGGVRAVRGRAARFSQSGEHHPRQRSRAVFLFSHPGIRARR